MPLYEIVESVKIYLAAKMEAPNKKMDPEMKNNYQNVFGWGAKDAQKAYINNLKLCNSKNSRLTRIHIIKK